MVRLSSPFLSFNLDNESIQNFVSDFLRSRNWANFELKDKRLIFVPYFLFEVELLQFNEDNSVKNSETKTLLFNASKNVIDDSFNDSINEIISAEKKFELPSNIQFTVLKAKYSAKTFEKIALIKASQHFKIPKQQILLLSHQMFFIPFWSVLVSLKNEEHELIIDAFQKKLLNDHVIVQREKGLSELASETIKELSQPEAWVKYSVSAVKLPFEFFKPRKVKSSWLKAILFNQGIIIIILIIILFILLYVLFFI